MTLWAACGLDSDDVTDVDWMLHSSGKRSTRVPGSSNDHAISVSSSTSHSPPALKIPLTDIMPRINWESRQKMGTRRRGG